MPRLHVFRALETHLQGDIESILRNWLPGGKLRGREYLFLNPTRDDKTLGSAAYNLDTGAYHDFADPCFSGKGFVSLFSKIKRMSYHDAALTLSNRYIGSGIVKVVTKEPTLCPAVSYTSDTEELKKKRDMVMALWNASLPLIGTKGENYLRGKRRIKTSIPNSIKYLDQIINPKTSKPFHDFRTGEPFPAIVVPITLYEQKNIIGVQTTLLRTDGSGKAPLKNPRCIHGKIKGACVTLSRGDSTHVHICEGVETGLSYLQIERETGYAPTVVCVLGAENIREIVLPATVKEITIAADNDYEKDFNVGLLRAQQAQEHFVKQGKKATVVTPPYPYEDFNDVLTTTVACQNPTSTTEGQKSLPETKKGTQHE
jgi:hypothetical protein